MKTRLKYICLSAVAGLTLSFSSCSDFMDLTPEDQYDEATVWTDADLTKSVVTDVYSYVCDIAQEVNPEAWTDDGFFTHVYGCRDINEATVSPSNLAAYDRDDCPFRWSKQFKAIYRANLVCFERGDLFPSGVYLYGVAPWFRWRAYRRPCVQYRRGFRNGATAFQRG